MAIERVLFGCGCVEWGSMCRALSPPSPLPPQCVQPGVRPGPRHGALPGVPQGPPPHRCAAGPKAAGSRSNGGEAGETPGSVVW